MDAHDIEASRLCLFPPQGLGFKVSASGHLVVQRVVDEIRG